MHNKHEANVEKPFQMKKEEVRATREKMAIYREPKREGPSPALIAAMLFVIGIFAFVFFTVLGNEGDMPRL
jgi:hypothetical protein